VSVALAAGAAAILSRGQPLAAWPVAAALMTGHAVNLGTGVLSYFTRVVGRPGIEARYGRVSACVNVAVTVALTGWLGLFGVCVGTAAGQVVGSLWFIRVVRAATGRPVRSFVVDVPWTACGTGAAVMTLAASAVLAAHAGTALSVALLAAGAALAWAGYRVVLGGLSRPSRTGPARTPRTPLPR